MHIKMIKIGAGYHIKIAFAAGWSIFLSRFGSEFIHNKMVL